MTIANFHNLIQHPGMKIGIRAQERPITFCKFGKHQQYTKNKRRDGWSGQSCVGWEWEGPDNDDDDNDDKLNTIVQNRTRLALFLPCGAAGHI